MKFFTLYIGSLIFRLSVTAFIGYVYVVKRKRIQLVNDEIRLPNMYKGEDS